MQSPGATRFRPEQTPNIGACLRARLIIHLAVRPKRVGARVRKPRVRLGAVPCRDPAPLTSSATFPGRFVACPAMGRATVNQRAPTVNR